jgi:hypothetical protein
MVRQKPVRDRYVVAADGQRITPLAVRHSWSDVASAAAIAACGQSHSLLVVGWTVDSEAGNDIRPVQIDGVRQRWDCSN